MKENNSRQVPMRVGVAGCGSISDIYLQNMIKRFECVEVVGCSARHFENAEKKAAQYGIRAYTYCYSAFYLHPNSPYFRQIQ